LTTQIYLQIYLSVEKFFASKRSWLVRDFVHLMMSARWSVSLAGNYLIYAPKIYFFTHYSKKCLYFSIIIKASPHEILNFNKILTKN